MSQRYFRSAALAVLSALTIAMLLFSIQSQAAFSQEGGELDAEAFRAMHFQRVAADIAAGNELVTEEQRQPQGATPCVNGSAGSYQCDNVDLLTFMPTSTIGGGSSMNDIWGWTDPDTGKEYALAGRSSGTSFVDVSDPLNPIYLGNLPTHSASSTWRDIKVYDNHAFIVSEATSHGMQVFDLTQLRTAAPGTTFSESAHYGGVSASHNIIINEDTGYAYIVGARNGGTTCSGGLHMVNIQNPTSPTFAGCFSSDGYTHDAQCVVYSGPDTTYQGNEVCFNANEDTVTIVDVTDKNSPAQLARVGYSGSAYTHQNWLNGDQSILFVDDELDELNSGHNTRTYVWDIQDLTNPQLVDTWDGPTASIDHNMYFKDNMLYQSQYTAGLYVVDAMDPMNLSTAGFFDVYPQNSGANFNGTWSNYPYFESGTLVVTNINTGLFILDYTGDNGPTSIELQSFDGAASGGSNALAFMLLGFAGLVGATALTRRFRKR